MFQNLGKINATHPKIKIFPCTRTQHFDLLVGDHNTSVHIVIEFDLRSRRMAPIKGSDEPHGEGFDILHAGCRCSLGMREQHFVPHQTRRLAKRQERATKAPVWQRREDNAIDFSLPRRLIEAKPAGMRSLFLALCRSRFAQQVVRSIDGEKRCACGVGFFMLFFSSPVMHSKRN